MSDLGTLGRHAGTGARAVNDRGQIVGYSQTATSMSHAFLWDAGTMIDLGGGGNTTTGILAAGINERGQVAGTFLWQDGTATTLGTLGGEYSNARAINEWGQIVGDAWTAEPQVHASLWQGGKVIDLGTLGGDRSSAYGINDCSRVVGEARTGSGESHAALWPGNTD
jgi:probable HAF family extracellular repeat protein